jgi:hypothetical protein
MLTVLPLGVPFSKNPIQTEEFLDEDGLAMRGCRVLRGWFDCVVLAKCSSYSISYGNFPLCRAVSRQSLATADFPRSVTSRRSPA